MRRSSLLRMAGEIGEFANYDFFDALINSQQFQEINYLETPENFIERVITSAVINKNMDLISNFIDRDSGLVFMVLNKFYMGKRVENSSRINIDKFNLALVDHLTNKLGENKTAELRARVEYLIGDSKYSR